ncbi:hypothetical protein CR513_49258, partial [Mucuna pruriens]
MDKGMIDSASGGALMDKTPVVARHLISNMASNTQQFGIKGLNQSRMVNEISTTFNQRLENQLTELTSLVRQLAVSQHQPAMAAKLCGICTFVEHPTDMCPTLQETESDQPENVGAIGGFQYGKQPYQTRPFDNHSMEDNHFGQVRNKDRPDEVARNQQSEVPVIRELQQQAIPAEHDRHHSRPQNADWTASQYYEPITLPRSAEADSEPNTDSQSRPETIVPLPFPSRTISARKPESDEELLKMFRRVEINIPLLDANKQIPKYAKFLKELCVHKRRKIKGSKEIGGVVSALTKNEEFTASATRALPRKCRDPGIFSVPCTIDECTFADAMLDLEASINVMPASIYRSLNFGDLEPTGMTIQLANRSIVQPVGVLEDVLV